MAKKISAVLLICGAVFNPWLLGYCFARDGKITSPTWFAIIFLIDFFFFIAAFLVWKNRTTITAGILFRAFLVCLVTLAGTEAGLQVVSVIRQGNDHPYARHIFRTVYTGNINPDELFEEYTRVKEEIAPITGWQSSEIHEKYINVNKDGIRKTINPVQDSSAKQIFVFGGSTIWGTYVPDDGTLPSQLANVLQGKNYPAVVTNYGEIGYTFMQDVFRLLTLLRDDKKPEMTIFYSGLNDIAAAYYYGDVRKFGFQQDLNALLTFKRQPLTRQLGITFTDYCERQSMIYRSIDKLITAILHIHHPAFGLKEYSDDELARLSVQVAGNYAKSYELLHQLSLTYHFEFRCILQPTIYTKPNLTPDELKNDPLTSDPGLRKFTLDTYEAIRKLQLPGFYDCSDVFKDEKKLMYFDNCHLTPDGNRKVAERIAEIITDGK